MPQGTGVWISPTGEVIEIFEHLQYLKQHRDTFGLSLEDTMLTPHEREAGPKGPAMARERLIKRALVRGWIRFRRAPGMAPTFDVWRITDDALFRIDEAIRSAGLADRTESIRVIDHRAEREERVAVADLLSGAVFAQNPPLQVATITFGERLDDHELRSLEDWAKPLRNLGGMIVMTSRDAVKIVNWNVQLAAQSVGYRRFESWAEERARELERRLDMPLATGHA